MKKILITIIMALFFVCCTYTVSLGWQEGSASAPTLGTTWGNGANYMMIDNDNVYCLQKGDSLKGTPSYTVKMKVEIRGCDAEFYNSSSNLIGKTSCNENNVLAAILTPNDYLPNEPSCRQTDWDWCWGMCANYQAAVSLGNGHPDYKYYSRAQLALYAYMQTWLNACSQNGVNLDWEFKSGSFEPISHPDGQGYIWGSLANCQGVADQYTCNVDVYYLESTSHQNLLIAIPDDGDPGKPDPKPPTTSITVKKEWKSDSDNAYKNRAEVTVELKADGKVIKTTKLNSSNKWTYTFEDLPTGVTYSVSEVSVPGYTSKVTKNSETSFTITNTLKTTSVKVTKKWADENNRDELRKQVTVTLYETIDGTKSVSKDASGKTRTGTLSTTDDSTCTFSNLPTHRNGKEIKYTVEETVPDKYTVSYSGNGTSNVTITNTHIPKVKISVTKVWNDCDNRDVKRPNSVKATLYANGVEKETVELNSSNSWKHTFNDLPTSEDGSEIKYTVKEKSVPTGYTATITEGTTNTFTITNTYEPEKTQVKVTKKWEDNENEEGLRPSAVTVVLYANGKATNNTITLSDANGWTGTFENLYKNQDGAEIKYTVQEAKETDVFTQVDGTTLENGKVIKDANGNEFVWVEVPKNATVYSSSTLNLNLDELTGTALTNAYKAIEKDLQNYVSAFRQDGYSDIHSGDDTYLGMTNQQYTTLKQKMLKSIFKNGGFYVGRYETGIYGGWRTESGATGHNPVIKKDAYPYNRVSISQAQSLASSFGTTEYRSSLMFGIQWDLMLKYLQTKGVSEADLLTDSTKWGNTRNLEHNIKSTTAHYTTDFGINWSKTPFNKTSADRIILTAGADDLFYKQNISDLAGNLHEMTLEFNTASSNHVTRGSYHGSTSTWAVNNTAARQNSAKDAGNDGKGFRVTLFKDEDIVIAPADYETTIEGDAKTGFIITNTYESEKTVVEVTKKWEDENNADGIRPTSITVKLFADEKQIATATLSDENDWKYRFKDLEKYANEEKIKYTVEEISVPDGYASDIEGNEEDGYVITNTHTPKTEISVKKEWSDDNNRDGKRPDSVEVTLYKNGRATNNKAKLNSSNSWEYTFKDLLKYENHTLVNYTVQETVPEGYSAEVRGDMSQGYTIKNTYEPETTEVKVNKVWEDNDNANNKRPTSITVKLMANGRQVATETLSGTGSEWSYTFENLNKYEAGQEINYTIQEIEVKGYTTKITGNQTSGFVITNKQEPTIIDIKGIVWKDGYGGKANDMNGIYVDKSINSDSPDTGVKNVHVKLYDKNNNLINAKYSDENGALTRTNYAITDSDGQYTIRVEDVDLTDVYVKFEYDGMTYTTVEPYKETTYLDNNKTEHEATFAQQSKAKEDEATRLKYDKEFPQVTSSNIEAVQEYINNMKITASTKDLVKLEEQKAIEQNDILVIENINLGLFEREQPNVAIFSDLSKVKVTMNEQQYTYLYGVRGKYSENVGLQTKFQKKNTYTYKRPVNPADIAYLNEPDNSGKEMEVLVTYKINVANLSTTLKTEIDQIVNVYDSRYEIYEIQPNGITKDVNPKVYEISDKFNQVMLKELNIVLQPGSESEDITITYKVNKDAVNGLLTEEPTLNNTVEICSYSTTYGKDTLYAEQRSGERTGNYAGFDYGSTPGNARIKLKLGSDGVQRLYSTNENDEIIPVDKMEDDTDIAPSFILCKDNDNLKKLSGTVWEDTDYVTTDKERKGNGKIDEGENWAENVKVEIYAADGSEAKLYNSANPNDKASTVVYTDANGEYDFSGIVTGEEYIVKFTYGNYDESEKQDNETNGKEPSENDKDNPLRDATKIGENEVNARNYKSTIITDTIVSKVIKGESTNKNWLFEHTDNYSVAVDNIDDRLSIPDLKNGNFYDGINMTAYTKPFTLPLEFDYTGEKTGNSNDDGKVTDKNAIEIQNELSKLDFGIIERPREDLIVQKTITDFSITLANGQLLTEGDPRDSETNMPYVKTMGFVEATNITEARLSLEKQLLVEMDTELTQGAKMEVTYEIKVINNNEIDYDYEQQYGKNYYYYGDVPNGKNPLPTTIQFVDYLNRELSFNQDENEDWDLITNPGDLKNTGYISDNALKAIQNYGYKVLQTEGETEGSKKITIGWDGEYTFTEVTTTKTLANKDENVYDNNAEIIEIDGKTARTVKGKDETGIQLEYVPGNYEPGEEPEYDEPDDDRVKIIITPPTGIVNYIISYAIIILVGLIVIFVGIVFIKKKVLNS